MKKKLLSFALIFFTLFGFLNANPIDKATALKIAHEFFTQTETNISAEMLSIALEKYSQAPNNDKNSNPMLYVINNSNGGYVVVSGDDQIYSILGYSMEGYFNHDNIPEALNLMLESYSEAVSNIIASGEKVNGAGEMIKPLTLDRNNNYPNQLNPLLGSLRWGQDYPYNTLCPKISGENTVVGCVATAMAQVMRYHQWPIRPVGETSYVWNNRTISINYNEHPAYQWDKMRDHRSQYSTQQEITAVSTLMYHVGVSVNMNYGLGIHGGSGTYEGPIPIAYKTYFGYNDGVSLQYRRNFNTSDWEQMIKTDLNKNGPIIYMGFSQGGGHAFVCDGYNTNGYYHINWGWDGMSDGYFDLAILDPDSHGTGGGSGGFSRGQVICMGITPNQESPDPVTPVDPDPVDPDVPVDPITEEVALSLNSKIQFDKNYIYKGFGTCNVQLPSVINTGNVPYNNYIAMVLYNPANEQQFYLSYESVNILPYTTSQQSHAFNFPIKIPWEIPSGRYLLIPVYLNNDTGYPMLAVNNAFISYLQVDVYYFSAYFSVPKSHNLTFTPQVSDDAFTMKPEVQEREVLYPNPVKDVLNINLPEGFDNIEIMNAQGAVVISKRLNNGLDAINLSALAPGVYVVKVSAGAETMFHKVIKQ